MTYSLGGLVYLAPGITAKLDLQVQPVLQQSTNNTLTAHLLLPGHGPRKPHSDLRDQLEHKCDAGSDLLNLQR